MKNYTNAFCQNESGAVTVDWVVLTAAIVSIGIAVVTVVSGGIGSAASDTNDGISSTGDFAGMIDGTAGGFSPASQGIYDNGYNYVANNTSDKHLAYSHAWANYQNNPTSDNKDFLAGAETALVETGFGVGGPGSPYTLVADLP